MSKSDKPTEADVLSGNAKFIKMLPLSTGFSEVRVSPLTSRHCRWWHEHVQTAIDESNSGRADEGWNWPRLYVTTKLTTVRYAVYGFAILGRTNGGIINERELPLAMALIVRNYPFLNDNRRKSSFLWFLSALPKSLYGQLGLEEHKASGRGAVDAVLCDSFQNWLLGAISLHADPAGGEELLDWYRKIGMHQVEQNIEIPKPRGFITRNDGRYFLYSPPDNLTAYFDLIDWR